MTPCSPTYRLKSPPWRSGFQTCKHRPALFLNPHRGMGCADVEWLQGSHEGARPPPPPSACEVPAPRNAAPAACCNALLLASSPSPPPPPSAPGCPTWHVNRLSLRPYLKFKTLLWPMGRTSSQPSQRYIHLPRHSRPPCFAPHFVVYAHLTALRACHDKPDYLPNLSLRPVPTMDRAQPQVTQASIRPVEINLSPLLLLRQPLHCHAVALRQRSSPSSCLSPQQKPTSSKVGTRVGWIAPLCVLTLLPFLTSGFHAIP